MGKSKGEPKAFPSLFVPYVGKLHAERAHSLYVPPGRSREHPWEPKHPTTEMMPPEQEFRSLLGQLIYVLALVPLSGQKEFSIQGSVTLFICLRVKPRASGMLHKHLPLSYTLSPV